MSKIILEINEKPDYTTPKCEESEMAAIYARLETLQNKIERAESSRIANAKPSLGFGEYRAISLCLEELTDRGQALSENLDCNDDEPYSLQEIQGLFWLAEILENLVNKLIENKRVNHD